MAQESSFDIVSEADMQLVDNTLQTTRKEIAGRYDFRGSKAEVVLEEQNLIFRAEDEYKLGAMQDIFRQKAAKQGVDIRFFDFSKPPESALGGNFKHTVPLKKGISREKAKEIIEKIKDLGVKLSSQIQGEAIRVAGKNKDDLQKAIQIIRSTDFGIAVTFNNYR